MNEQLKVIITAEIAQLRRELDDARREIDNFSDKSEASLDDYAAAAQQASAVSKKAFKVIATSIAAVTAAFLGLGIGTKEYRQEQAKLTTAFDVAGATAEDAKQTYNDLYRVLGDSERAVEAANHLAKLTTNQKELKEWTEICKGVYATFGASLPIESLTEAINETAKTGEITGALADALNWAGKSEEAFAEELFWCNTEAEREALIRGTLNDLYKEASGKYEETASGILAQNEAQAKLSEAMAKLGEIAAPILAILSEYAAVLFEEMTPAVEEIAKEVLPILEDGLVIAKDVFSAIFDFIKNNWKWLSIVLGIITVIVGILATVFGIIAPILTALAAIAGFAVAIGVSFGTVLAIIAAIFVFIAGYGTLFAIIIGGIIAIVVYWEEIVEFFKNTLKAIGNWFADLWAKVVDGFLNLWEWLTNILSPISDWIYKNVIEPVITYFTELWKKIVATYHMVIDPWIEIIRRFSVIVYNDVIKPILDWFIALWNNIKAIYSVVASWFNENIVQPLLSFFTTVWNGLVNGAKWAWEGIKSVFSALASFFKKIFSEAWQGVLTVFAIGGKIFNGIKEGITAVFKTVVNHIIGGINAVIAVPFRQINNILSKMKQIEILGVKPFDWVTQFNIPQIPKLEKGGILRKGQIGLLEGNGAEAVVPLEKNTGWINEIAGRLSEMLDAGDRPIILQVDGKTFAQTSLRAINQLTRQTGKLDLVMG